MDDAAARRNGAGRNPGIDILRIVSMLMVVTLHTLGNGGVLGAAVPGSALYWCAWFMECAAFCAVDCYALISGYVGWRSEFRVYRLIRLWLQVFFWSAVSAGAQFAIHPESFGPLALIQALFPVLSERYWYFTAYFIMCFFIPLMNRAIGSLSREKLWSAVLSAIGALSLISLLTAWKDTLSLNDGYHFLWLSMLYMLGGCLSRYPIRLFRRNGMRLAAFFLCAALLLLSKLGLQWLTLRAFGEVRHDDALLSYLSPLVIAEAVLLLNFFAELRMSPVSRLVSGLSGASFGVYLIHTGSFFWVYLLRGALASLAELSAPAMCLEVLAVSAGIYGGCAALDTLRKNLFELLRLPRAADNMGERLENLWTKLLNKLGTKAI